MLIFSSKNSFQSLIKEFGRKRLQELGAHKRKKEAERLAKQATSNPTSPIGLRSMVNSSAGLLHRVIELGRHQTKAAELIKSADTSPESDSQGNEGNGKDDKGTEQGRGRCGRPRGCSNTRDNQGCEEGEGTCGDGDTEAQPLLSATKQTDNQDRGKNSMWGFLCGKSEHQKGRVNQGKEYTPLGGNTPDTQLPLEADNDTSQPLSPEHFTVMVDTDESELDPDTPHPSSVTSPCLDRVESRSEGGSPHKANGPVLRCQLPTAEGLCNHVLIRPKLPKGENGILPLGRPASNDSLPVITAHCTVLDEELHEKSRRNISYCGKKRASLTLKSLSLENPVLTIDRDCLRKTKSSSPLTRVQHRPTALDLGEVIQPPDLQSDVTSPTASPVVSPVAGDRWCICILFSLSIGT